MKKPRFHPPESLDSYSGFIFDCDGTLVDTMGIHHKVWRQALKEGGATFEFTWDLFVSRAGMSLERTVEQLSEQYDTNLDSELIARRHPEIFRTLNQDLQPIPEVVAFARRVAAEFPVAVASGSTLENVKDSLRAIDALELFPIIITPESVTCGKPDPEMFLLAAEKMGVPPEHCLVLEDGELGFEAARRAGMEYAIVKSLPPQ